MNKVLEYFEYSKKWMSKITRKNLYIFGFGLLSTMIILPMMTVVSCGESVASQTYRRFKIASDAVIFDISKVDPAGFVSGLLGTIGTRMNVPIYEMSPTSEQNYALIKNYLNQANFTKDIIRVTNSDKSYDLDFKEVHHWMDELKKITAIPFSEVNKNDGYAIGIAAKNIFASDLTKVILSGTVSTGLAPWLKMYDAKPVTKKTIVVTQADVDKSDWGVFVSPSGTYLKAGDTYEEISGAELTADIVARHPYLNLLRAYHKVFWGFVNSDLYKEWSKDKTFIVAENKSPIIIEGTHDKAGTQVIVKSGEMYDLPNSLATDSKGTIFTTETSNLEFQFFYNLLDLA